MSLRREMDGGIAGRSEAIGAAPSRRRPLTATAIATADASRRSRPRGASPAAAALGAWAPRLHGSTAARAAVGTLAAALSAILALRATPAFAQPPRAALPAGDAQPVGGEPAAPPAGPDRDQAEPQPAPTAGPDDAANRETADPEQEGEVIVIDSRAEKPLGNAVGAVEVVNRAAIVGRGARNVGDALRGRVGIEIVPALRGTAVRAQGLDPSYVLILVDGLPAIGRISGALDVDRLPVDNVERIEVIKGPSSALFGSDALGGVINIVTRDADRPFSADARAIYGSRDRVDASATAAARRQAGAWQLASRAAVGMRRADGYDLDPSTIGTEGSAERAWDGALRLSATRGMWRIVAGGDYVRQDLRGIDGAETGAVFDRRSLSETGSATLAATARPREDTTVAATLRHSMFHDQFLYDQRGSDELDDFEITDERMTSAAVVATRLVTPAHLVTAGVDGSAEGLSAERLVEHGSRERLGLYAQDEWLVVRRPQLILVPGGRIDTDTQFGFHATPKLSARLDVTDRIITRASAGAGYRAPDFRQLYLRFENPGVGYRVEGNPDLEPESSIGGTLSVEVEPVSQLAVAVQGYWNEIDDLIAFTLVEESVEGEPALYRYVNLASARTRGVELQVRANMGKRVTATAGYSLADTLDRELDREIPDRARHRGSFELRVRPIERLQLATHGELVGERVFFTDSNGDGVEDRERADRYAWIGARAEVDVASYLSVFAGVDNIADAGDSRFLAIAPRAFYAGVRGHYELADPKPGAVSP